MSGITFFQIFFVCLIGAISPGPSMVVVINNAIFKNRFNGIVTSIGHGLGISIYALFAVIGIGLIIKTNIMIFNGIKVLSIIFLFYLGIKSIITDSKLDFKSKNSEGGVKSFLQGFSISILNPKIFIWFVAIYSQFMSSDNDLIFNSYLVLTAGIIDASWYILLTFLVTSNAALNFLKAKNYLIHKFIGILFILIAFMISLEMLI
tara:strand:+ start:237 stop:851 length:615 start_codon:yes stop_codon:yes gene_type:complete